MPAHQQHDHGAGAAIGERRRACRVRSRWSLTCCRRCRAASIVPSKLGSGTEFRERVAHHPAGDLAVAMAAEPVGHGPDPDLRPLEERVLVDLARQSDVACGGRSEADRRRRPRRASPASRRYRPAPEPSASDTAPTCRPAAPRTCSDAAGPSRSGNSARRPTSLRSTRAPAGRTATTGAATAAARRPARARAVRADRHLPRLRAVVQHRRRGRVEHDPRRQAIDFERVAQLDDLRVEALEIDVVGRQRLDDQPLGAVEERRRRRSRRRSDSTSSGSSATSVNGK